MNANSIFPNERYQILDTIQAVAADLSVANGLISIGNPLAAVCQYRDIVSAKIVAPVAETLQVTTLTPVAAANSVYSFFISQYDYTTGNINVFTYSLTSAASGETATTICNKFRAMIAANPTLKVTGSGAATLILTAQAGYAIFTVTITATGGGLTQATGTAGVRAVNTLAQLQAAGFTNATAATYTVVTLMINQPTGFDNKNNVKLASQYDLLISQGATNRAALVTAITEALGNLVVGGVTASIENFALV